jgi:tRNA A37 threonylcarbamoyltransferase TsaD
MLVLGLETSCDETGAAVVAADGRVLADVVQSQVVTRRSAASCPSSRRAIT